MTDALPLKPARVRIAILVAVALVYALGTQLPLPGLEPNLVAYRLPGQAMTRLSVAALGVTPFISAILLIEIAQLAVPPLARWAASPANAGRCETIVWALPLTLAALQGFGLAVAIEAIPNAVAEPGAAFRFVAAATTLGATAILGALARATRRAGAGDGFLIVFAAPRSSSSRRRCRSPARWPRDARPPARSVSAAARSIRGRR